MHGNMNVKLYNYVVHAIVCKSDNAVLSLYFIVFYRLINNIRTKHCHPVCTDIMIGQLARAVRNRDFSSIRHLL